jgi:DNA polymerase-3 subunit beta
MKLTIDRAPLLKALDAVRRIAGQRTTIPILSHLRLATENGRLTIEATDLDIEMRILVDAAVQQTGALVAPAATLHDLLRKLPEKASLALEQAEPGAILLRSGRTRAKLPTLPTDDWPSAMAPESWTASFRLSGERLATMLARTAFATSNEETRYYLNGTFTHHVHEGGRDLLRMVTTDGHRLARFQIEAPEGAAGMPGVIVPRKAGVEIERLTKGVKEDVAISVSSYKLRVEIGDVTISTKLIDGTFPDYTRVIPQGNDKRATLCRADLAAAADRVSTISSERGRAVKLSFAPDLLTLSVTNSDMGTAVDEVEAAYDGPPLDIGFNSRYLAELLTSFDGDTVRVSLADPGAPTVFQSTQSEELLVVLMPMRV